MSNILELIPYALDLAFKTKNKNKIREEYVTNEIQTENTSDIKQVINKRNLQKDKNSTDIFIEEKTQTKKPIETKPKKDISKKHEIPNVSIYEKNQVINQGNNKEEKLNLVTFKSPINDKNILIKAINENGYEFKEYDNNTLEVKLKKGSLIFKENDEKSWDIMIYSNYTEEEINQIYTECIDNYTSGVQEQVYETLIQKAQEKNYTIESEIISQDDSIILTLNVDD